MFRQIFVLFLLVLTTTSRAIAQKDSTMQPIEEKTLAQAINNSPLASSQQGDLIGRAYSSGLAAAAYVQYTHIWRKSPQDVYTNLRRGQAAENYWHYATRPDIHEMSLLSPQSQQLQQVAKSCLALAWRKSPNSPAANTAYGYYLFWYASQMKEGISLMKKAVALDPKSSSAHVTLGDAYAEQSGDDYNPNLAERELKIAAALKPLDAFPHWRLIRIYLNAHRFQDAQRELQSYSRLIPASSALADGVKDYQSEINKGVNKS